MEREFLGDKVQGLMRKLDLGIFIEWLANALFSVGNNVIQKK